MGKYALCYRFTAAPLGQVYYADRVLLLREESGRNWGPRKI